MVKNLMVFLLITQLVFLANCGKDHKDHDHDHKDGLLEDLLEALLGAGSGEHHHHHDKKPKDGRPGSPKKDP